MAKKNVIHCYPWYIADWSQSETVASLSLAERGLYRELLDQCYAVGSIPNDPILIARMIRTSEKEVKKCWERVTTLCFQNIDGRLFNDRASTVLDGIAQSRAKQSRGGRDGSTKRWTHGQPMGVPIGQPTVESCHTLSHPHPPSLSHPLAHPHPQSNTHQSAVPEPVYAEAESLVCSPANGSLIPPNLPAPAEEFVGIFLAAGVKLSEADVMKAYRGTDRVKGFLSYEPAEQAEIVSYARTKAELTSARFLGLPVNMLDKQEWLRRGPGRLIPEPPKSKAEAGQREAERLFDAHCEAEARKAKS